MPAARTTETPVRAARGGRRSAPDSRNVAPSTCGSDCPNMLSADSSGESVARNTRTPRASPPTVWAMTLADEARKSGVNSGVRKSCR